jgi:hypothetical protein
MFKNYTGIFGLPTKDRPTFEEWKRKRLNICAIF